MFRCLLVLAIALTLPALSAAQLKVTLDKDNVVSSRLEGQWTVHASLTTRLGQRASRQVGQIEFEADKTIVESIPEKYHKFLADQTIYMAGTMKQGEASHPFLLVVIKGNPHIVYFRERDGDPLGDAESFNVMLAVAEQKSKDLLFIGGDFNNQAFTAYERRQKE